jgi:hypothetical protein
MEGKCQHYDECQRRFEELSERILRVDSRWRDISAALVAVEVKLAALEGRMAGYLVAASLLGTVVAFLAAYILRPTAA